MFFSDRLVRAQEAGDIWSDQWWRQPTWRNQISLTDEELASRFSLLSSVFDKDWVMSLGEGLFAHQIIQDQVGQEGMPAISRLLRLSSYLVELSSLVGFNRVLSDFKTIQHVHSAEFELFMAHCLLKAGCEVDFIVPKAKSGKTPDISANLNGYEFVVECKRLTRGPGEPWISGYERLFSQILMDSVPEGVALNYQVTSNPLDIQEYGYPNNLTPYELSAHIDTFPIVEQIKEVLNLEKVPLSFEIPGKGICRLFFDNESFRGRVEIPEVSESYYLKRLFLNGVFKANDQISGYGVSGVAAVFQEYPAGLHAIKRELYRVFENEKDRFKLLMGVLVFPAQNILKYIRPYWVKNPWAVESVDEVGLEKALEPLLLPLK